MLRKLTELAHKLDDINCHAEAKSVDRIIRASFDEPILDVSPGKDGESMIVEWLNVPEGQRGRGIGRRVYLEWEQTLPPNIKKIFVYAEDLGFGSSKGFWAHLGFKPVTDHATLMAKEL